MAEIGKSLVFFLKYYPEMVRLYDEKGTLPDIEQHRDRELIIKRVEDVGRTAGAEAASLLTACIADMQGRLEAANIVRLKLQRRRTIEENWGVEIDVWPLRQRHMENVERQIGIHLHRDGLIPWVWSRGGMAVEDEIRSFFAKGVKSFGSKRYEGWSGGSVSLEMIPVDWESAQDFVLDAGGIIEQAKRVLEAISPEFIKKFIAAQW
jgi:hypothetical protein